MGVPGELRGWEKLYLRHGSGNISWTELFQPAIKLARYGYKVNVDLAAAVQGETSERFSDFFKSADSLILG